MRIILAAHSSGMSAGAEKSLVEIAKYLFEKGDDILIFLPEDGPSTEILNKYKLKYKVIPYKWSNTKDNTKDSLASLREIYSCVQEFSPDIIITNTSVIPWFAFVAKLLNIPHIWFLREVVQNLSGTIDFYPSSSKTLEFIKKHSSHYFVNSKYTARSYLKSSNITNSTVIYPSFDKNLIKYKHTARMNKDDVTKIIVFSSISPYKNQVEVLEALSILKLKQTNHKFHLTIMGPIGLESYYNTLLRYISENKLSEYVTIKLPQDNPYETVSSHDIAITPSINEPFGRVTIEASYLGCLVIASNSGGNIEISKLTGLTLYELGDPSSLADLLLNYMDDKNKLLVESKAISSKVTDNFINNDNHYKLRDTIIETINNHKKYHSTDSWIMEELFEVVNESVAISSENKRLKLIINRDMPRITEEADLVKYELKDLREELNTIKSSKVWKIIKIINKFRS